MITRVNITQYAAVHQITDVNERTGHALAQAMIRRLHLTNNGAASNGRKLVEDIDLVHKLALEKARPRKGCAKRRSQL